MKKNRRAVSFVAAVVLLFTVGVNAFAKTVAIPNTEISVELGEDVYCIEAATDYYEDIWAQAGIEDVYTEKTNAEQVSASLIFTRNNAEDKVYVSRKDSDDAQMYYNLNELDSAELQKFADMYNSDSGSMLVRAEVYSHPVIPFVRLNIESGLLIENETYYEQMYFTIVNGYSVSFRTISSKGEIKESSREFLKQIVDSFNITELKAKKDTQMNPVLARVILAAVAAAIIILFVVDRKQKESRRKASLRLADSLAEYRLKNKTDLGKPVFVNDTTHTDEAIKAFSKFQTFRLNIMEPILSIVLPLVAAGISYVVGGTWWVTILLGGFAVYSLVKLVTGPGNIERALTSVYGKMKSRTAHYEFYEEEFTISGMQARGVFPYFQITRLEKNRDMAYIYFGEGTTYFVSRDGFSKGDFDEFIDFIYNKAKE